MKKTIPIFLLLISSFLFSQVEIKPNKEIKIIKEIKGDFDNDGLIDKFIHCFEKNDNSSQNKSEVKDTIQIIKLELGNNKILKTKPFELFQNLKIEFKRKSNELIIISEPNEEESGRLFAINLLTLKYDNQFSNFIIIKSESDSLNRSIKTNYITQIKEYKDNDDGYRTTLSDKNGSIIWLKEVNYKEKILKEKILFSDVSNQIFTKIGTITKKFEEYIIRESKKPKNKYIVN